MRKKFTFELNCELLLTMDALIYSIFCLRLTVNSKFNKKRDSAKIHR